MHNIELETKHSYLAVGCTHRVYLLLTNDTIPFWTWLLRGILRLRQGTKVTHTHTLVAVQHVEDKVLQLFEMDYYNGMNEYHVEYEGAYFTNGKLSIDQQTFSGGMVPYIWDAVDVTQHVGDVTQVEDRFYAAYTDERLTPRTLLLHLTPAKDKVTWTCTGLSQVLLGWDKQEAFNFPLTPDQLRDTMLQLTQ